MVVAGTSQLFVYRIIHDVEASVQLWFIFSVQHFERLFVTLFNIYTISEYVKGRQGIRYVEAPHLNTADK